MALTHLEELLLNVYLKTVRVSD